MDNSVVIAGVGRVESGDGRGYNRDNGNGRNRIKIYY